MVFYPEAEERSPRHGRRVLHQAREEFEEPPKDRCEPAFSSKIIGNIFLSK
jgi:hypothetical protein